MKKIIFGIVFAIVAIVILSSASKMFETNKAGYYQVKQAFYTGNMTVRNAPGTYGQMLGSLTTYDYADEIFLSADDLDGGGDAAAQAVRVLFPNGSCLVDLVAMYELSLELEYQLELNYKYNSNMGVRKMVRQQILEAIKNTGSLMSAEEAYSTKRSEFASLAKAQCLEGLYVPSVTTDTVFIGNQKSIVKHYSVKVDSNGNPIIKKASTLAKYNIGISQFNVKDMVFDDKTTALIDSRKEAQKAAQDAITAKARGEATIAKEKALQETEKIKQVTKMEADKAVAVLKAQKEFEVAALDAKKALENKKKVIAEGQAAAESNRLKVAAGLTPQEKAEWDYKTAVGVAEAIAKRPVPTFVTSGGGSSQSGLANSYTMENMLLLQKQLSKK